MRQPSPSKQYPGGQPTACGLSGRALTGLRGVAALLIVVHHYALLQSSFPPALHNLAHGAYLAVDLFFVLSGYVMALAYGHWFTPTTGWPHHGLTGLAAYIEFILRRLARLWPLHAVVVLTLLAQDYLLDRWMAWPKLIACNLLLVQGWGISQSINPPSWSISTELAAYLLFPLLSALVLHGPQWKAWAALAAAAGLLVIAVTLASDTGLGRRGALDIHENWSVLPLLRCLGGFTIGLVLFRAVRAARLSRLLAQPWTGPAIAASVLAMLGLRAPDLLIYPLLPVLVAAVHLGVGRMQRVLASSWPHRLGVLSYALYLVHYPIIAAVPSGLWPSPYSFVACLGISLGVASGAHRLVEWPARLGLRRLVAQVQARLAYAELR